MRIRDLVACTLLLSLTALQPAHAAKPKGSTMSNTTLYAFQARTIDGKPRSLADFKGKTVLVVNTASRCGFTPQYEGLEALYQKYRERGFEVLAFPANDFMGQEPGTNAEIQTFCSTRFKTTFPLFEKISVKGKHIDPIYRWLTVDSSAPGDIPWNFTKFLIGPDGQVIARYSPNTKPDAPELVAALEKSLGAAAR